MVKILLRRDSSSEWTRVNPVLSQGEPAHETDTGRFKLGDGVSTWNELDYFLPEGDLKALINQQILEASSDGSSDAAVNAHINDANPHPVYDDGPSFLLLYQNAKV